MMASSFSTVLHPPATNALIVLLIRAGSVAAGPVEIYPDCEGPVVRGNNGGQSVSIEPGFCGNWCNATTLDNWKIFMVKASAQESFAYCWGQNPYSADSYLDEASVPGGFAADGDTVAIKVKCTTKPAVYEKSEANGGSCRGQESWDFEGSDTQYAVKLEVPQPGDPAEWPIPTTPKPTSKPTPAPATLPPTAPPTTVPTAGPAPIVTPEPSAALPTPLPSNSSNETNPIVPENATPESPATSDTTTSGSASSGDTSLPSDADETEETQRDAESSEDDSRPPVVPITIAAMCLLALVGGCFGYKKRQDKSAWLATSANRALDQEDGLMADLGGLGEPLSQQLEEQQEGPGGAVGGGVGEGAMNHLERDGMVMEEGMGGIQVVGAAPQAGVSDDLAHMSPDALEDAMDQV